MGGMLSRDLTVIGYHFIRECVLFLEIKYIELKTGYHDDGPAWIGHVMISKSGRTLYFNNHAFQKHNGISGNYHDIESGEEYWISGVKKGGSDRHRAGKGRIVIDRKVVEEYLKITGKTGLDEKQFLVQEIADVFPVERISVKMNKEMADNT